MADDKLNNNDQLFLDLIEKANEFLNPIPCANCNSRSGFNQEQQGEQSEQTHQPPTVLETASPKQPNQDAEQRSETNSNTICSLNKIWKQLNLFRNHRNDCTNNSLEETAGFLKVDEKVGDFIKERLNENILLKRNKKWGGVVACLVLLTLLLGGVLCFCFQGEHFDKISIPVNIVTSKSYDVNGSDTFRRSICYDTFKISLDSCKRIANYSVGDLKRCDNIDMSVGPQGIISYSYRKYDKLFFWLAILLAVGICTALVFFVISLRKTVAAEQEYEKSELEYRHKLVDKYVDALLDGHLLEVQRQKDNMESSRQQKLFQMDIVQKEHEYEWQYVSKNIEIRKTFLDSLLETVKKKQERSEGNKKD